MLDKLFISMLNMSFIGSYVIVFVLIARLLLKKAPKIFSYSLWGIVLFRLLCPVSFESVLSLVPTGKSPIPQDVIYSTAPQINTGIGIIDNSINPLLPMQGNVVNSVNPIQIWVFIGTVIWLLGMFAMIVYGVIAFVKLKRSLIGAAPFKANIYLVDHISSPFVMGLFKPKIYLPSSLLDSEKDFIIAHEICHIRRFDHVTRILGFVALTAHWFNPLVWIAFIVSGKDMELSCDEAVMKTMNMDIRAEYSQLLLRFGAVKSMIHATPLAFGESDTKSRVKNVLNYKKPAFWVIVISVIVIVAVGIGLVANPKQDLHFAMTGMKLSELQPEKIAQRIAEIKKVDAAELEITADNFGLLVSSDFQWVRSEAIRFVFTNKKNVPQSAQLRIFTEESDFFVTETKDWVASETYIFKLQRYLEALKYLPQEAIVSLCKESPQRYAIELADGDRTRNPKRCIYYDKNGVTGEQSWRIRIDIMPLYHDGTGFEGVGDDVIHLYYSTDDTALLNAMRPMILVEGVLYLDTGKEVPAKIEGSAILGEITSTVGAAEKPTENGQCNFNSGVGAKYATYGDGIAVFLDNKWFFFEKELNSAYLPSVLPLQNIL